MWSLSSYNWNVTEEEEVGALEFGASCFYQLPNCFPCL